MNLFPGVVKNTLAQGLGRVGVVLVNLLITALLARFLGVNGYGNYVFIIALILFFVSLADWGTNLIFVREAAKKKTLGIQKFFSSALLFRFLLAIIALVILNVLVFFLPALGSLAGPIRAASLLLILISLKTSCHVVFQASLRFEFMAIIDVVISFLFLVILFLAFLAGGRDANLVWVMLSFVIANFLGTILAFYLVAKLIKFNLSWEKKILKQIIYEALPTGALLFVFSVYNRLDIFLLQFFKGAAPVGIYGLSYKIHDNLVLGAAYLMAALFPLISAIAHRGSKEKLVLIYRQTFDLLLLAGLGILVGVMIFAPAVVSFIGGSSFGESVLVLRILAFATVFAYFNHLTGYTLIALGKQKVSLVVALTALLWNLSLNLIFIPQFSYLAAAIITVTTEGLVFFLTSFYLGKTFALLPGFSFPKTFVALIKTKGKIF